VDAIRRRTRAFLGLPAPEDTEALTRPRVVPWLAAPAAFVVALLGLVAIGVAVQQVLPGRDNWQVNAPAIAGLTAILLLAPSSPTQPRARNAVVAAIAGLAIAGAGYAAAVAGHQSDTTYSATAFLVVAVAALAGCVQFTALTRVERWSVTARAAGAAGTEPTGTEVTGTEVTGTDGTVEAAGTAPPVADRPA